MIQNSVGIFSGSTTIAQNGCLPCLSDQYYIQFDCYIHFAVHVGSEHTCSVRLWGMFVVDGIC